MAQRVYAAGSLKLPLDTREYMSTLNIKLSEADVYITADGGTWDRKDVQYVHGTNEIFMFITYDV